MGRCKPDTDTSSALLGCVWSFVGGTGFHKGNQRKQASFPRGAAKGQAWNSDLASCMIFSQALVLHEVIKGGKAHQPVCYQLLLKQILLMGPGRIPDISSFLPHSIPASLHGSHLLTIHNILHKLENISTVCNHQI